MKKKNYITGADGFIGRHLFASLEDPTPIPHDQIPRHLAWNFGKFFFLSTYGNMAFHTEESRVVKANVTDLIDVLGKVDWQESFESFIYFSTSSVRLKVQTMYSRCKRAAEELLLAYAEMHSAPICVVRPFSVTGPGEQKEHLIPTLVRAAYTGEAVDFVPEPVHDFIDVRDVVAGTLALAKVGASGIYELGNGKQTSNQEVLAMVEEIAGKKVRVRIVPQLRSYDTTNWHSLNSGDRDFGWQPKISLEQSITDMVAAYERLREENH